MIYKGNPGTRASEDLCPYTGSPAPIQDVDGIKLSEQTHLGDPNFAGQQSDIKSAALGASILLGSQGDTWPPEPDKMSPECHSETGQPSIVYMGKPKNADEPPHPAWHLTNDSCHSFIKKN